MIVLRIRFGRLDRDLRHFLVGVNSVFDVDPIPVRDGDPWEDDWRAVAGDFEVVGDDMRQAIAEVAADLRLPDTGAR